MTGVKAAIRHSKKVMVKFWEDALRQTFPRNTGAFVKLLRQLHCSRQAASAASSSTIQ